MLNFIILAVITFGAEKVWGTPTSAREPTGNKTGRIVGGDVTKPNQFPYQLALELDDTVACGATILNENYAITAAHCTHPFELQYIKVIAGEHSLSMKEGNEQIRNVADVIEHGYYKKDKNQMALYNDIALLRFDEPLVFNQYVQPIAMAPRNYIAKGMVTVTGWGAMKSTSSRTSDELRTVQVPIVDHSLCKSKYAILGVNITDHICAGYIGKGGKDSCQGDSGGPMITEEGGKPMLVGIVSFGANCAHRNYPGVYTPISKYRSWIDPKIKQV